jgi:hypothetical protein
MGRTYIFKVAEGGLRTHAAEIAGLGILAAPSIYHKVTGKEVKKNTTHNAELLGLGTLAAPSAFALGKHIMQKRAAQQHLDILKGVQESMKKVVAKPKPFPMSKVAQAQYDAFFDELEKIAQYQMGKEAMDLAGGFKKAKNLLLRGSAQAGGAAAPAVARYTPPGAADAKRAVSKINMQRSAGTLPVQQQQQARESVKPFTPTTPVVGSSWRTNPRAQPI